MHTPPPEATVPPARQPLKFDVSIGDLDALDHVHHDLDRARLMLRLAVECDTTAESEHRRFLLDAALDALTPAFCELARTIRQFRFRVRDERVRRAQKQSSRATPLPERPRWQQKKFQNQAHRR
jgi:hypothetical protein